MTRALASLLAFPLVVAAAPAYAAVPTVDVEVDVSALPPGDVTERLQGHLLEHQNRVVTDTGLELADNADATIRVIVSRYGEGDVHYRATVALLRAGAEAVEVERMLTCELCRDGELVLKVGEEVEVLAERALYAPADEQPDEADAKAGTKTEANAKTDGSTEPNEDTSTTTTEKPKKLGPLGGAAIASIVVGTGTLAAGIPLALAPDRIRPSTMGVERRTTRPTGIVLASVGGVLLASGAALLAIDVLSRKRQRRVSFLPTASPSMMTVSIGMRF